MRQRQQLFVPVVSCFLGPALLAALAGAQTTERVSVSSTGAQSNGESYTSYAPILSGDGSRVVFSSYATNLAVGTNPLSASLYMRDRTHGVTALVSVNHAGVPTGWICDQATISADGRFVAFSSGADDLVVPDTNSRNDIFVRDLRAGTTFMASVASNGAQSNEYSFNPVLSANGRFLAFSSRATNLVPGDANNFYDIYLRDNRTGILELISSNSAGEVGNLGSVHASLSADGRFVAFESLAMNLVPGDGNVDLDVFLKDRFDGSLRCVSLTPMGAPGSHHSRNPAISGDGRWVAFASDASDLVPGDTNGKADVFLRDVWTSTTTRVSLAWNGGESTGPSVLPSITPDGRFVAYTSSASDIVPGDANGVSDVFVHDRILDRTRLVSVSTAGAQGDSNTAWPSISSDGRTIASQSNASNLVGHDTNGATDVFVHVLH